MSTVSTRSYTLTEKGRKWLKDNFEKAEWTLTEISNQRDYMLTDKGREEVASMKAAEEKAS